jgi:drug/metabolite transporter (DMT)-like permease
MFHLYWPIALIVISNTLYHICAKSAPADINPFASLTVTYMVAAIGSAILFFATAPSKNLLQEYTHVNWTVIFFGVALIGLEVGSLYMYKVGWNVNTGYLLYSIILSIVLLFVGLIMYGEAITLSKVAGIVICTIGMYFLTK